MMIDFLDLSRIYLKKIEENSIIRYPEVLDLCAYPYPNHPKGCPNQEKCCSSPYFDILEPFKYYYLLYLVFNYKKYKELRREEHPEWTENQTKCVLYWQNSLKRLIKDYLEDLYKEGNHFYIIGCGSGFKLSFQNKVFSMESMGINVFSTLKRNGIGFEVKPRDKVLLVNLLCSPFLIKKHKQMRLL